MRRKMVKTLLRTILPWRLFSSGTKKYTRKVRTRKTQLMLPLTVLKSRKMVPCGSRQLSASSFRMFSLAFITFVRTHFTAISTTFPALSKVLSTQKLLVRPV